MDIPAYQIEYDKAIARCDGIVTLIGQDWLNYLSIVLALVTLFIALIGVFSEIKKNPKQDGFSFSNIRPIGYIIVGLMVLSGVGNVVITNLLDKHQKRAECYATAREDLNSGLLKGVNELVSKVNGKTNDIIEATGKLDKATSNIDATTNLISSTTKDLDEETIRLNNTTKSMKGTVEGIDKNVLELNAAVLEIRNQSRQLAQIRNQVNEFSRRQYEKDLLKEYKVVIDSIDSSTACGNYSNNSIYWVIYADGKELTSKAPKEHVATNGEIIMLPEEDASDSFMKTGASPSFTFSGYVRHYIKTSLTGTIIHPYNATFEQDVFYTPGSAGAFIFNADTDCSIEVGVSIIRLGNQSNVKP